VSQARKVRAGGLDHHVLEWISPERSARQAPTATVLLLHGYMDVAASWDAVARGLASEALRVLAPDLRGFGDAPRVSAGTSYVFADYIADVGGLVDALAPSGPLFVVGHSMGGVIGTLFAGTFPDRVQKFAMLEGLGPPDSTFEDAPDRMRAYVEGLRKYGRESAERPLQDLAEAVRRLALNHPHVPEPVLKERAPLLVRPLADGRVAWRFDPLHRVRSPIPFYAAAFRAFAARVACPVLAVSGGATGYHPTDEAERLSAFRDLRVAEIEGAGHMMHWTRPDELAALLRPFLAA
jgi:pimeloyl-ACP methyl ester carboxylesterase